MSRSSTQKKALPMSRRDVRSAVTPTKTEADSPEKCLKLHVHHAEELQRFLLSPMEISPFIAVIAFQKGDNLINKLSLNALPRECIFKLRLSKKSAGKTKRSRRETGFFLKRDIYAKPNREISLSKNPFRNFIDIIITHFFAKITKST
jgi:hypothetical protein